MRVPLRSRCLARSGFRGRRRLTAARSIRSTVARGREARAIAPARRRCVSRKPHPERPRTDQPSRPSSGPGRRSARTRRRTPPRRSADPVAGWATKDRPAARAATSGAPFISRLVSIARTVPWLIPAVPRAATSTFSTRRPFSVTRNAPREAVTPSGRSITNPRSGNGSRPIGVVCSWLGPAAAAVAATVATSVIRIVTRRVFTARLQARVSHCGRGSRRRRRRSDVPKARRKLDAVPLELRQERRPQAGRDEVADHLAVHARTARS